MSGKKHYGESKRHGDRDPAQIPEHSWRRFLIHVTAAAVLLSLGLMAYLTQRGEQELQAQVLARARSAFQSQTLARRWNADHQGVYVLRRPGDAATPPFLNLPDVPAADGRVLRPVHPAAMTREISAYATDQRLFTFRLSSTRPLNPANQPDPFELEGYEAFAQGAGEHYAQVIQDGAVVFRYVAPLYLEQGCIPCHEQQGYKVGDIRGAVSVSFDISGLDQALGRKRLWALGLGLAACLGFVALVMASVRRLSRQVRQAQKDLSRQARVDELTGLANRRHFFERLGQEMSRARRHGRSLALIMMDLDRFKQINDRHGHLAGDKALAAVARALASQCRSHDLLARYGGEELALLLPEIGEEGLLALAEKLRKAVAELAIEVGRSGPVMLTISLGLVRMEADQLRQMDDNLLVHCADQALYQAKEEGRNRIVLYQGPLCPAPIDPDPKQGGES